jgi:serine/threonine-protein kinase
VHRDVKLDNLFLCDPDARGRRAVKVLDFGIAKVIAPPHAGSAPAPSRYPTGEGVLVGTPRYLSPEQARGEPVDARADVYAAGLVLYALLAGRGPFEHRALLDLLRAHASEVPDPPSRHAPGPIPAALDRAVMTALEKDPDRRFPGASAFAERLAAIAGELARGAEAPRGRWLTTEPLARSLPDRAPGPWIRTAPLSAPPVRALLEPTIKEPAGRCGPLASDPRRALEPTRELGRPRSQAAPYGAFVPVLVAGALVLGFALAVLFRLGG